MGANDGDLPGGRSVATEAVENMERYDALSPRRRLILRYSKDPHGLADELLRKGLMGVRQVKAMKLPIMPITMKMRRKNRSKSFGLLKNEGGGQSENLSLRKKPRRESV